jgi:hypothetical protein
MSSSIFLLTPTLDADPRLHLREWKISVNRYARTLLAQYDPYGLLSAVADPVVWQALPANIGVDAAGNVAYRALPTYPAPTPLIAGDGPATRDIFKAATDARHAHLSALAKLTTVLLTSIGETNRNAIAHPLYDTQLLTPRGIMTAMSNMHGVFTQSDVDALNLPLTVKLPSLSTFEAHVAAYRHALAALTI